MIRFLLCIFSFAILVSPVVSVWAAEGDVPGFRSSGLPVPRYVSLRSDHIYARTGPGMRYPIKWVFQKDGLPVEVIQEFDTWRKVRDKDGETGWIHQSLLSGARSVIVLSSDSKVPEPVDMRRGAGGDSRLVARAEPGVVGVLRKCDKSGWCQIDAQGFRGWIDRHFLWGIYPGENLD
ncbi:MAG: hypothetical protein H6862_06520 [Rhodospirillales bacterium]|nr:hypothetical protein [Rhodospirillales bacterium]